MSTPFIVFQLGFNIVVLAALIALAWKEGGGWRLPRLGWLGRALRPRTPGAGRPPEVRGESPSARTRISPLVEQANRDELAAEQALRRRLAQYRARREAS